MNIFHTLIIKVASAITAVLLFVGVGTPDVTVVDVQDSGVTVTTATSTAQEPQGASVSVSATVLPPAVETAKTTIVVTPATATEATTTTQVTQITPTQAVSVPVYIINPTPAMAVEPTPQPQVVASVPATQPMQTPTFEVKNPLPGKGLGRTLKWRATPIDELNEIVIGAVLTNPDGSVNNTSVVTVTATDDTQNKVLNGTGNTSTFGDPSNPKFYYPFTYDIKTPGLHKITFTSDLGVSVDVSINVTDEDTR